jgi:hypothetical protein
LANEVVADVGAKKALTDQAALRAMATPRSWFMEDHGRK